MNRFLRTLACVAFAATMLAPVPAKADDAPATGVKGELVASLNDAGGKIQQLAGAMPEAKYAWRPGKGVRSTGEVYLHVVGANYLLGNTLGATGGMSSEDAMKIDTATRSKAETIKLLEDSYAFANKAILGMTDADLESTIEVFGQKMSKRALAIVLVGHSHEHLGQSIAYARMNGVVPPWSAPAPKKGDAAKK